MHLFDRTADPTASVSAVIEPVNTGDVKKLTRKNFLFNWSDFSETELWKIRTEDSKEILGVMSLTYYASEERIEINLIASKKDNVGTNKRYDRIAGCLIGWACRLAVKEYGSSACVSLKPKTKLAQHYQRKYGMKNAGQQLFLDGISLYSLIRQYVDYEP